MLFISVVAGFRQFASLASIAYLLSSCSAATRVSDESGGDVLAAGEKQSDRNNAQNIDIELQPEKLDGSLLDQTMEYFEDDDEEFFERLGTNNGGYKQKNSKEEKGEGDYYGYGNFYYYYDSDDYGEAEEEAKVGNGGQRETSEEEIFGAIENGVMLEGGNRILETKRQKDIAAFNRRRWTLEQYRRLKEAEARLYRVNGKNNQGEYGKPANLMNMLLTCLVFPMLAAFYFSLLWEEVLRAIENRQRLGLTRSRVDEEAMNRRIEQVKCLKSETVVVEDGTSEELCAICLDTFQAGETTRELRCSHIFHQDCIDKWLITKRMNCPTCIQDVSPTPPPNGTNGGRVQESVNINMPDVLYTL